MSLKKLQKYFVHFSQKDLKLFSLFFDMRFSCCDYLLTSVKNCSYLIAINLWCYPCSFVEHMFGVTIYLDSLSGYLVIKKQSLHVPYH